VADPRRDRRSRESLDQRRERALARIGYERAELAADWRALAGVVRQRERGALAVAQGLATALRLGGAAAAVWMAGRIRGPRFVRRGVMLMTAARSARRLLARPRRTGGRRWRKA
jgi:hypothetical protein